MEVDAIAGDAYDQSSQSDFLPNRRSISVRETSSEAREESLMPGQANDIAVLLVMEPGPGPESC